MRSTCRVLVILLAAIADATKLPSYVKVCKTSDPDYDACVLKSVESLRPRLAKGIAKLHIPPLEPLVLPELVVNRELDPVFLRLRMTNFRVYGLSHFRIEHLKYDPVAMSLSITSLLPAMQSAGEYGGEARLLSVPLKGKGTVSGNFTNIRCELTALFKMEAEDGVKRLSIVWLKAKVRIQGEADVELVNNDKTHTGVTDAVNTFLNQNRKQVYGVVYPIVDDIIAEVATGLLDGVLQHLDADELFPE